MKTSFAALAVSLCLLGALPAYASHYSHEGRNWQNHDYRYNYPPERRYWHEAPPPVVRPDTRWHRGDFLPHHHRYEPVRHQHYRHLHYPPHGYRWVRAGNEYLLVAMATGLIADVIWAGR